MSLFEELKRRNVVRVAIAYSVTAWLVAQIAELALENFGAPDWVLKTLLFLLVIGLLFAMIFAWAYELTPEGIKREKDVDRSESITPQTGRRIDYVIIGVLSVALIVAVATHQWTDNVVAEVESTEVRSRQSIAVLPFVNMSDDPGNEYFSDGISEELLNVLVRVQGLRVASRTSSFSFKGANTSIPEIAAQLDVNNILEGSVRKSGNKVRITAQLIDVNTDAHLWSETYDRELDDIFAVQDEISLAIVNALASTLGTGGVPTESVTDHSTENVEAYELYLRGRFLWQRRGNDVPRAIEMFERAVELDPQFGRAWSSLAAAHITMPSYIVDASRDEHHALAQKYALKALEIDDSLAEAHAVLGELNRFSGSWNAAEEHYLAAIDSEPSSATAHLWYSEHLQTTGRLNAALAEGQIAHQLDPLSPGTNSILITLAESTGDTAAALSYAEAALTFGHPWGMFYTIEHRIREKDFDGAYSFYEEHKQVMPPEQIRDDIMRLWIQAYEEGTPAAQDKYIDTLQQEFGTGAGFLVVDLVQFGRLDDAFEMIGTAEDYWGNAYFDFWRRDMAALRSDPRFLDIMKSRGVVEHWDTYGWSPLCERVDEEVRCH